MTCKPLRVPVSGLRFRTPKIFVSDIETTQPISIYFVDMILMLVRYASKSFCYGITLYINKKSRLADRHCHAGLLL